MLSGNSSNLRIKKMESYDREVDRKDEDCQRRHSKLQELDEQLTIMDRELRAKEEEMNIRQLLIQYSTSGLDVYEILAKQHQSDSKVKKLTSDMYRVQEKLANAHQSLLEKERIILNLKNKVQSLEQSTLQKKPVHHLTSDRNNNDDILFEEKAGGNPEIHQLKSIPKSDNSLSEKRSRLQRRRAGSLVAPSAAETSQERAERNANRRKSIAGLPDRYTVEGDNEHLADPVSKACLVQ